MFNLKNICMLACYLFSVSVFASDTPQISQQALLEALTADKHNIVLLDVRSKKEYNHGHIAGALNFSHDTVADNLTQLAQYKDKTLVVYCRSGRRAAVAETILNNNGFSDVRHLTGDMNGWLEAKRPVVHAKD